MIKRIIGIAAIALALVGCGQRVEVPPAHVGKVMTKDGYQENVIPTSKFRLPWCWTYCDKLVLLNASDQAVSENLSVFMPEDKLNLATTVQVTLSVDPKKVDPLFSSIAPVTDKETEMTVIPLGKVYQTYAQQIILTETREYLSKYSIAEIASNLERVNTELREQLTKSIQARSPFTVRNVGITKVDYPKIITDAQENAAERREKIQQEEAQLAISKVSLERELQETRLRRQIELEKAQIEAQAQRIQREVVDEKVLALRKLENERAWIEQWNGQLPDTVTVLGDGKAGQMILNLPK